MRTFVCLFFLLSCLILSVHASGESRTRTENDGVRRILFIGNSLTYTNDLPDLFQSYVAESYPTLRVVTRVVSKPGATLDDHRKNGEALEALLEGHWDFVVIQGGRDAVPGGTIDGVAFYQRPTTFLDAVRFFTTRARAQGALPILFQSWGEDKAELERYNQRAYELAAIKTKSVLAPVGAVFERVKSGTGIKLVGPDGVHPTRQGTTLATMVLARAMFGPPTTSDLVTASEFSPAELRDIKSAIDDEINVASTERTLRELPYGLPASLSSAQPLELSAEMSWCAKEAGFRYSLGAIISTTKAGQVRLLNFTPSARLELPIENLSKSDHRIDFDTTTGGVEYHLSLVRADDTLRVLTSSQSDATHHVFQHATFESSCHDQYFDNLTRIYDRLEASSDRIGLAKALSAHYKRLKAMLGEGGIKKVTAGFGLDEWDPIMVSWVYDELENHDAELRYLKATVELFPNSVDAKLYLSDALSKAGNSDSARKLLQEALSMDGAKDEHVRKTIEKKLTKLNQGP